MVYCCSVDGCRSNYPNSNEKVPVFDFPADSELSARWERFAAGTNKAWSKKSTSKICVKHFEPRYVKRGEGVNGRSRLVKDVKPVPTIFSPGSGDSAVVAHMKAPIAILRMSPKKRVYQEDEYAQFLHQDVICRRLTPIEQ